MPRRPWIWQKISFQSIKIFNFELKKKSWWWWDSKFRPPNLKQDELEHRTKPSRGGLEVECSLHKRTWLCFGRLESHPSMVHQSLGDRNVLLQIPNCRAPGPFGGLWCMPWMLAGKKKSNCESLFNLKLLFSKSWCSYQNLRFDDLQFFK